MRMSALIMKGSPCTCIEKPGDMWYQDISDTQILMTDQAFKNKLDFWKKLESSKIDEIKFIAKDLKRRSSDPSVKPVLIKAKSHVQHLAQTAPISSKESKAKPATEKVVHGTPFKLQPIIPEDDHVAIAPAFQDDDDEDDDERERGSVFKEEKSSAPTESEAEDLIGIVETLRESLNTRMTISMRPSTVKRAKEEKEEKELKRETVVAELISTEGSYLHNIQTLIFKFLHPLRSDSKIGVSKAQVEAIFSNIELLASFHTTFLMALQQNQKKISTVFLKYADYLKLYTNYLNGYETALENLNSLKANRRFQEFLKSLRSDPEIGPNTLMSYLIMPVQRVPRYELLLKELKKCTPVDHPEFESLHQAYEKVKSVAEHINQVQHHIENSSKLLEIQNKLKGKLEFSLIDPTRHLIREGLFLQCSKKQRFLLFTKKVILFLFNDLLLVTTDSYSLKAVLPIQTCFLENWTDAPTKGFKAGMLLSTAYLTKHFACESEEERDIWLEQFKEIQIAHIKTVDDVFKRTSKALQLPAAVKTPLAKAMFSKV